MPTRPNILFFFTDQHRLSALGCYGPTPCQTPNLDRLAAEGVRFETAYTSCPVCSPARASIMTGQYPHAHGVCSNVHNLGCSVHELQDRPELLSRRMLAAGYQCGYTGKWHLGTSSATAFGAPNTGILPKDVGFEGQNFPGHGGGGFGYPEYQAYLAEHGFRHQVRRPRPEIEPAFGYGVLEDETASSVPYFLADNTIAMIDRFAATDQPFFVWHNNWGPHGPYFAPPECYELYRDVDIPEWPNFRWPGAWDNNPHQLKRHARADELSWAEWAEAIRHYYAFATHIDEQIGRILDHLRQIGQLDNTIVVVCADHGETLGSHGGLTDKGWHHFEEIQRIPLIVRLPEALRAHPAGTVLQEWQSLVDLYPTLLDMAGCQDVGEQVQGRSFYPLLRGEPTPGRDLAVVEFFGVNSLATSMITIRRGDLKYGWNCASFDELYDLAADPHEMDNLIADPAYSEAIRECREALDDWMSEYGFPGVSMYRQSRIDNPRGGIPRD